MQGTREPPSSNSRNTQHGRRACCFTASSPHEIPVGAFCASKNVSCPEPRQPCDNRVAELFSSLEPSGRHGCEVASRCISASEKGGIAFLISVGSGSQSASTGAAQNTHRNNSIISRVCVCVCHCEGLCYISTCGPFWLCPPLRCVQVLQGRPLLHL